MPFVNLPIQLVKNFSIFKCFFHGRHIKFFAGGSTIKRDSLTLSFFWHIIIQGIIDDLINYCRVFGGRDGFDV